MVINEITNCDSQSENVSETHFMCAVKWKCFAYAICFNFSMIMKLKMKGTTARFPIILFMI